MGYLYDDDVLELSRQHARVLRCVAADKAEDAAPDWLNVVEKIEAVGRTQLSPVRTALIGAIALELKSKVWPIAQQVTQWYTDARVLCGETAKAFSASMRAHLVMQYMHIQALVYFPESLADLAPLPVPATYPVTLDETLAGLP